MNYTGIRVITGNTVNVGGYVGAITEESSTLRADTDYILQFKIINYGTNNTLDHIVAIKDGVSHLISSSLNILEFPVVNIFTDEGITKQERLCYIKFRIATTGNYKFGICRTLKENDSPNKVVFDIRETSCERGIVLQDYKDNTDDLQNFIKRCETYFEQNDNRLLLLAKKEDINKTSAKIDLSNESILLEVNKKVSGDNIIASINMSPEQIQISANLIDMTGKLDLNGTFKCYRDGANKTGHYLYQSGAMHRGYLEGASKPVFSSGIWRPDNVNDVGYVSVGWTNSDNFDDNGCIYLTPIVNGGGSLTYGKLIQQGVVVSSGIDFYKDGYVRYNCFVDNKEEFGVYAHVFDSGISSPSIFANQIKSGGYFVAGGGLYTDKNILYLSAGGKDNPYGVQLQNEGYMYPSGNTQLGTSLNPWYALMCTHAPQVVSDARKKKNIHYVNNNLARTLSNELTLDDMYNYVKSDLKLATYQLIDSRDEDKDKIEIGFMIQDIKDTKVGEYIANTQDENNYTYDMANRISVLEGALQIAIKKIEELEERLGA